MAGHSHSHGHGDDASLADILDLDGEVFRDHVAGLTEWVAAVVADPARIVDLGAGTGSGAIALLERFPAAEIWALDVSPAMLGRFAENVRPHDPSGRVHAVPVDIDHEWPSLPPIDLIWASASLHHLADPDRTLAMLLGALRPGGLLTVIEVDSFPRFLPDDAHDDAGLERRIHAIAALQRARDMPSPGADWGERLRGAGFVVEEVRHFDLDLPGRSVEGIGRYAEASLIRVRERIAPELDGADRRALDRLLDPRDATSIRRRTDLRVRTAQTVWLARRSD